MSMITKTLTYAIVVTMMNLSEDVVERDLVGSISIAQKSQVPPVLTFSGIIMDSFRGVTTVKMERQNDSVNVLLGYGLGGTAGFRFDVEIPVGVNVITLGKKKAVIWSRHGTVPATAEPN